MRTAILSDVHANLEALRAVLDRLAELDIRSIVCLGDCVGYGGDPSATLNLLFEACDVIVAGNHDHAATGQLDSSRFNELARAGVAHSRSELTSSQLQLLRDLPLTADHDGLLLAHASPLEPQRFSYLRDLGAAYAALCHMEQSVGVVGHTHLPVSFLLDEHQELVHATLEPVISCTGLRVLANVGSVGQPRDRDPRACFAVFDSEHQVLERHRVDYDVERAAARIAECGLPQALGRRLLVGV